jgi:microsomal prostaglandin-E synthase 1
MMELRENPSFWIFCIAATALSLNMLGLWGYSGAVRGKSKTTPNAEDPSTVSKGAKVTEETAPEVARVLRAHRNANDNIVPFLILAFLYVVLGASPKAAWILFGGFTAMRYLHTVSYLSGKQPWRTLTFVAGGLITMGVMVQILRIVIPRMM